MLKLIHVSDGDLGIYCRYPTGSVVMLASGQVKNGHRYNAWYRADAVGDYKV
jgi:hypothetical protein